MLVVQNKKQAYRHFQPYNPNRPPETVSMLPADSKGRTWFLNWDPAPHIFTEDLDNLRVAAFRGPLIDRKGLR